MTLDVGVAGRRLIAQRLAGNTLPAAADVVRHFVAVQSQDYPGGAWALGQRLDGWTEPDIGRVFDAGELIRTHVLRPTWHFVTPEDLRWLLALTGPRLKRADRARRRALQIDDGVQLAGTLAIERAIAADGPRTRSELRVALASTGIETDPGRFTHLIMHAELDAVVCSGPRRAGAQTYALVAERVPPAPERTREEALAELATRYVAGHGPAQDIDFAWWAGLSLGDARRGLAAASPTLDRDVVDGRTFWFAPVAAGVELARAGAGGTLAPTMHLLPNYDELLVAFRDRRDGLHPDLPEGARDSAAILNHVIVRDGRVVGRWYRPTAGSGPVVRLEPRIALDADDRRRLRSAVDRYAAFVGRELEVTWLD
ncbi:MAG: winged helix DNA-binding domain-containing protein [Chloroflexota bacterium]